MEAAAVEWAMTATMAVEVMRVAVWEAAQPLATDQQVTVGLETGPPLLVSPPEVVSSYVAAGHRAARTIVSHRAPNNSTPLLHNG